MAGTPSIGILCKDGRIRILRILVRVTAHEFPSLLCTEISLMAWCYLGTSVGNDWTG